MGTHSLLSAPTPIVLFDSTCLLCNKSVQLLLKIDKKKQFKFAGLTSETGTQVLKSNKLDVDSIVLLYNNQVSTKSTAILKIARLLGFPYSLFLIFYSVPKPIRNWVYDIVAVNRLKWFGNTTQCIINQDKYSKRILP